MAEFYDTPMFIVKKMAKVHNRPKDYEILTEKGNRVAEILVQRKSLLPNMVRIIGAGSVHPMNITIRDMKNRTIMTIKKSYTAGLMKADVYDELERLCGKLVQGLVGKLKVEGYKIDIVDTSGKLFGTLRGDWKTWLLQLRDEAGNIVGKLTKGSQEVNKVLFPDDDFFFFHQYIPIPNDSMRKMLLGTCAVMDILLS